MLKVRLTQLRAAVGRSRLQPAPGRIQPHLVAPRRLHARQPRRQVRQLHDRASQLRAERRRASRHHQPLNRHSSTCHAPDRLRVPEVLPQRVLERRPQRCPYDWRTIREAYALTGYPPDMTSDRRSSLAAGAGQIDQAACDQNGHRLPSTFKDDTRPPAQRKPGCGMSSHRLLICLAALG